MVITLPKNFTSGKELVIIPSEEYENLMIFKKIFEFQPSSLQRRVLDKTRKNRRKGVALTIGALKQKLGLTD